MPIRFQAVRSQAFPKTEPSGKILLALQYWKGDRDQAMRLARFIADLQHGHSDLADFLFVSRFDCGHDDETVKYVSRKFDTHTFISRRRGKGWPHGSNDLWFALIEHVNDQIEKRRFRHYKAVFTFEADCVPLSPRWINHFIEQFDAANATRPTYVMGALLPNGPHINGNALFKCDLAFTRWLSKTVSAAPPRAGWDYVLAGAFAKWGWAVLAGLKSYWNSPSLPESQIEQEFREGTVFIHGIKDDSLLTSARRRLL